MDLDREFNFLLESNNKSKTLRDGLGEIRRKLEEYNSEEQKEKRLNVELLSVQNDLDEDTQIVVKEFQSLDRISLLMIKIDKYRLVLKNKMNLSSEENIWLTSLENSEKLGYDKLLEILPDLHESMYKLVK